MLVLLDLRALIRAGVLDRVQHLLNLVFRRRGTRDENQIVQTLFHIALVSSSYSGSALAAAVNLLLFGAFFLIGSQPPVEFVHRLVDSACKPKLHGISRQRYFFRSDF